MLRIRELTQAVRGFGEKLVGLNLEMVGTLVGNDRLKNTGRDLGDAGSERLRATEEEIKAAARQAEAKGHETRQRAFQSGDGRSRDTGVGDDPSAARAAAESVKGTVKEAAGRVAGSRDLAEEGREQRERGRDEGAAAKHETKAGAHREKAEVHREAAERRRS